MNFSKLNDRFLLFGLFLCCLLYLQTEALPTRAANTNRMVAPQPQPQPKSQTMPQPPGESIFNVTKVCPIGTKLTGNPPDCHRPA